MLGCHEFTEVLDNGGIFSGYIVGFCWIFGQIVEFKIAWLGIWTRGLAGWVKFLANELPISLTDKLLAAITR